MEKKLKKYYGDESFKVMNPETLEQRITIRCAFKRPSSLIATFQVPRHVLSRTNLHNKNSLIGYDMITGEFYGFGGYRVIVSPEDNLVKEVYIDDQLLYDHRRDGF